MLTHNHQSRGGYWAVVQGKGGGGCFLSGFRPFLSLPLRLLPLHHSTIHVLPLSLSSNQAPPTKPCNPTSPLYPDSEAQPHPTDMELNDTCFQVRTVSQWGMEKKGERGKVLERKRALIKSESERDGWWVIHRTK